MTTSSNGGNHGLSLAARAPGGGKVLRNPWGKGSENQPARWGKGSGKSHGPESPISRTTGRLRRRQHTVFWRRASTVRSFSGWDEALGASDDLAVVARFRREPAHGTPDGPGSPLRGHPVDGSVSRDHPSRRTSVWQMAAQERRGARARAAITGGRHTGRGSPSSARTTQKRRRGERLTLPTGSRGRPMTQPPM